MKKFVKPKVNSCFEVEDLINPSLPMWVRVLKITAKQIHLEQVMYLNFFGGCYVAYISSVTGPSWFQAFGYARRRKITLQQYKAFKNIFVNKAVVCTPFKSK